MWTSHCESESGGRVLHLSITFDNAALSYASVLGHWKSDSDFRTYFIGLLSESPFAAFRWETPPITRANANRPFEFVLIDSPGLASNPDQNAFAQHFNEADVVEFANLGKDAVLVVPCPQGPSSAYGHLAAFIRDAPEKQRHALWQMVGDAMSRRLSTKLVWLSTAGAGVSWLHLRLDDRPKYYGYTPYRLTHSL